MAHVEPGDALEDSRGRCPGCGGEWSDDVTTYPCPLCGQTPRAGHDLCDGCARSYAAEVAEWERTAAGRDGDPL